MSVTGERAPADHLRARPARSRRRQDPAPAQGRPRPDPGRRPDGRPPPALPEMNEPDVVRHYVNLSQLNYAVDTGFYPLGSCTMKFNPKLNEWAARLPGFANLHPMAPDEVAQGTLQLLWELERALAEISGMRAVTLQPAAGAQGELTGILMIRAHHRATRRGRPRRGPRPGFEPRDQPGDRVDGRLPDDHRSRRPPDGGVDLDAFRAALGPRTAAVMITNPSTLGLFEARIGELLDAVHAAGALAYMDGANLNAILGRFKPGEAGFDVMHFNVHKTFSTPHGGGGPGAGPVGVGETLLPYLPVAAGPARRRRDVPARAAGRAADLDRAAAQLRRQHRRPRARVCLYPGARRIRPARGQRRRGPRRQLPQASAGRDATTSRTTAPASTSSSRRRRPSRSGPASGPSTSPSASSTTATTRRRSTSR